MLLFTWMVTNTTEISYTIALSFKNTTQHYNSTHVCIQKKKGTFLMFVIICGKITITKLISG